MTRSFLLLLTACILLAYSEPGRAQEPGEIHWMTWQEAMMARKDQPRKIFIDMYTHWCGWCKKMDASTFHDSVVAANISKHFYAVKFDAETRDSLDYRGDRFGYRPDFKVNELAAVLLNGQMSYPTVVYLDEELNLITPVPGYMTAEQILPILTFFGEDIYKNKTWEEYSEEFRKSK
ncbi:MAG: thioredoxin family protein [Bacteroidota bacterium]